MIVTLAGHVDHGKTTLVRLLTGTDTDRLVEEQRRGLTIDLGFAYLNTANHSANHSANLSANQTLGFVDVPGHHRFIHNMVAGVAAMQHALLVVAADDGPMPQSREHLQILELLGISRGTIVLSKCDGASRGRIDEARDEIRSLVAGSFLEAASIIETSAVSGDGIDTLRDHLTRQALETPAPASGRPFRMPVDRAFTLKGPGLVVTGTVHAGQVHRDDIVHVFPLGAEARVRDLRVQNAKADQARAGDRAAINLAGLDSQALRRGHWLCAVPESGHHTAVVDLKVLDDFPRHVRHWSPVHVYHATSHTTARLALLEQHRLQPGQQAWVELVLDEPLPVKHGHRVVIRDHALERTLGGGSVIDNRPAGGRRRAPERLRSIEACTLPTPAAALEALLREGPVNLGQFQGLWDLSPNEIDELLRTHDTRTLDGWLIDTQRWQRWRADLVAECRDRHTRDATLQGLRENDFQAAAPAPFRARLLGEMVTAGALEQRAGRFSPRRHQAELSAAEHQLLERLQPLLDQPQPPSLGDVGRTLGIPLPKLKAGIKTLASKGSLVQVNDKRVYLPAHLAALAETAETLSLRGPFTARDYRDAAGIGRNVAIDLLEFFDARGFTRRQGETRTVVGDRSKLPGQLG